MVPNKLKLRLCIYNTDRFMASLEDEECDSVDLAVGKVAAATCRAAAKKLRELADGFDELADLPNPTHGATQDRINRKKD